MRKLIVAAVFAASCAAFVTSPARAADADPSMHQIYEVAQSGHLDQAQDMIGQVLRDHPRSGKAHYVAAELYARAGKIATARAELGRAEELAPGLPFAKPAALQALRSELALAPAHGEAGAQRVAEPRGFAPSWGMLILIAVGLGGLWMLVRRRDPGPQYANVLPAPGGPAGAYPAGYGVPPAGPMGGGLGSGIAGGLASGLAVGAGVVAGEELAHHLLDGGERHEHERFAAPPSHDDDGWRDSNADMGGTDFGVNDPGSWDDGGSSGGGGDDWT